jgi:hypothetical protein
VSCCCCCGTLLTQGSCHLSISKEEKRGESNEIKNPAYFRQDVSGMIFIASLSEYKYSVKMKRPIE